MDANENGVGFSKGELRLLRQFGSKDITSREFFGVHVNVTKERVFARASDGKTMAVELDGISDGKHHQGEWFVSMKFLIDGRKELEGKELLRLRFGGASLHEASIEQAGIVRLTLTNQNDAAISDVTLPGIVKQLKKPSKTRERVHCMPVSPAYLHAAALAGDVAEDGQLVTIFPPSSPDGFVIFEVDDEKNTSIRGAIASNVTAESISDDDEEDQEEPVAKPNGKGKRKSRQPSLALVEESETAS